jgi:hypothetical protein
MGLRFRIKEADVNTTRCIQKHRDYERHGRRARFLFHALHLCLGLCSLL